MAKKKSPAINPAILERLKKAEEEDKEIASKEGYNAGQQWAQGQARPKHLRRLAAQFDTDIESISLGLFLLGENDKIGVGLQRVIESSDEPSVCFWDRALNCSRGEGSRLIEDQAFATSFIQGALTVWDAYKDKL